MRLWKNMAYHGRSTQPNGGLYVNSLFVDYNKHVRSKKSGAAADSVFHPTWKWYTPLQFLKTGEEVLNRIYRH